MCDVCADFLHLLESYESRIAANASKHVVMLKGEIETAFGYIQAWPQRQCMCLYRDAKNYERFNLVVQSMIMLTVNLLKRIDIFIEDYKRMAASPQASAAAAAAAAAGHHRGADSRSESSPDPKTPGAGDKADSTPECGGTKGDSPHNSTGATVTTTSPPTPSTSTAHSAAEKHAYSGCTTSESVVSFMEEPWALTEIEKLLFLVAKVFLLNFPLYIAYKHGTHARLDDISAEEVQHLAIFCDLHDNEIPVFLLRNISMFCHSGGFSAMMFSFEQHDLPVSTAHAITAALSNIKLWLNYGCVVQLFVPLRSRVLQYMCKLSDQSLRSGAARAMADFVWSAIRDPLDPSVSFDEEGLALAFKYFTSTTLTMRLAGMSQINSHISYFNEICTTELVGEGELVGQKIAQWLTDNQLIYHLFGPNLHVEVIKQAHVVLNFLAVENQITEEDIKLIWQATQLKHCSKTIFDIMPALVKNLSPHPAMYLYSLLCRMDPKDHNEQSIYIASNLTKMIWTREGTRSHLAAVNDNIIESNATATTSESGSMDGSNSEDEHGNGDGEADDSSLDGGGGRKSPLEIENLGSDMEMPPCSKARRRRHICDPSEEKVAKQLTEDDLNLLKSKVVMKRPHSNSRLKSQRLVGLVDNSSSEEDLQSTALGLHMQRKKSRKRRMNNNLPVKRVAHDIVETIWDRCEEDEPTSDEADDGDAEIINDSDDGSDEAVGVGIGVGVGVGGGQVMPHAIFKHLQGPFIRAIGETHISELLSGAENDTSYSSPMSNKSEKNLGDFEHDVVSLTEEEVAQLIGKHTSAALAARGGVTGAIGGIGGGVVGLAPNCVVPPEFAAAAAAMAAAHSAMSLQKTDVNVAAAAVAVAAAAVATNNAQQSLEVMRQQAAAAVAAAAASKQRSLGSTTESSSKPSDSEADALDAAMKEAMAMGKRPLATGDSVENGSPGSLYAAVHGHSQPTFKVEDVCQPGNTLLWDLIQDDKIGQLGEHLALEAEKTLGNLLLYNGDRVVRTKFVEGCLNNLANNRSVLISLRLLPKLLTSLQHCRPTDPHQLSVWAERHHRMMYHFFNNIKYYAKRHARLLQRKTSASLTEEGVEAEASGEESGSSPGPESTTPTLYSHKTEVSVRLQFLTSIFSTASSPKGYRPPDRLTLEQVDALWEWLAHDPECSDLYFSWLQSQAKGGDQQALGIDALQHLYLKKLPELRPENFSMVALGLFQQLCSLARMAMAQFDLKNETITPLSSNVVGMAHLWKIALRAYNTEVSLAAIQYINMFYMGQQLRLEKEFVSQCMDNLVQAANALENNEDEHALMCVQRGLMLLNTHLDTFRRRYAFHLRRWAIEGKGIGSHSNLKNEGAGPALRIILQPAGLTEKSQLHMHTYDLVADLKAEISKWWENLQGATNTGASAPVLGLLLSEGPLRIITQGQELTSDYDERSLGDAGLKDNQIVYVSLGGRGARRKETNLDHPSMQPPPPKECLPTVLLLQPKYFEKLFCLMQTLGDMKPKNDNIQLHTKAQLLSRRVWDILAMLPTNPLILDAFKSLNADLVECEKLATAEEKLNMFKAIKEKLGDLLDPANLQKFMYSLHIVESLAVLQKKGAAKCCAEGSQKGNIGPVDQATTVQCRNKAAAGNGTAAVPGGASKKGSYSARRRNSNESSSSAKEDSKRNSSQSNTSLEGHLGKDSESSPTTTAAATASNESDYCEGGGGNDKENNPAGRPNKRHKRSDAAPPLPPLPPPTLAAANTSVSSSSSSGEPTEKEAKESLGLDSLKSSSAANAGAAVSPPGPPEVKWSEAFIKCGGLQHLYRIFISGQLQRSSHPKEIINEWRHDCLGSLLRLLWLLGFEDLPTDSVHKVNSRPHPFMLEMMDVHEVLHRLATVLDDEAYQNYITVTHTPYQYQYHHLRTGMWSRAQVVQFTMNIMVSFVHASPEAKSLLWSQPEYCGWVRKFLLEDPEPSVRREICAGLYRISMGNSQCFAQLMGPLLLKLISFLPQAERISCFDHNSQFLHTEEGKEPYGPACRDYFWLLVRMVDSLTPDMVRIAPNASSATTTTTTTTTPGDLDGEETGEAAESGDGFLDIERMCPSVAQSILRREYNETRHGYQDDGLVGLMNLMQNLVKYDPSFKFSQPALDFIEKLCEFLFDMPTPSKRYKPKCKSATSRAAAYDLLAELCRNCPKNYISLHAKLLAQHTPGPLTQYPWDYWPRDEGRSECGYVGLTNLGATCYMASCIQHLYMMPQARAAILNIPPTGAQKHGPTLRELQRMFAYLYESERKAYNPRSFCRVYQMDHQPLNTGEQKDMAEFFIDLVSKLEEMTPDLKDLVKRLFCGTLSNNVVSLDCDHVSRTAEEFYTVRCQVADMRNLQESLDEVTVKDTLEGDNMYTCSQCGKKVRAEKRACFKKLPQILCFNTMRYTFNMVTMLKEKVNTHFSFPMRLNMADYTEKKLMPQQYKEEREKRKMEKEKTGKTENGEVDDLDDDLEECSEYELVGVTVHTGTADGGHYYSFIKERNKSSLQHDRWFLFNDAEVKPFDPSQIAAECFGGEMTSKTYDSVTEKYLDFSFEKTNSAYMLFYERCLPEHLKRRHAELLSPKLQSRIESPQQVATANSEESPHLDKGKAKGEKEEAAAEVATNEKCDKSGASGSVGSKDEDDAQPSTSAAAAEKKYSSGWEVPKLSKELEDWIWQDNRQYLQDRNIFEHTYFSFMWQLCSHIPQTLIASCDVTGMAAKLSVSFFIETFIHAKEKPTMVLWMEMLTKQFNISQEACEWFLSHMANEPWWPVQVLIQCPNQTVRQMFQRLIIHVIQRLRSSLYHLYLDEDTDNEGNEVIGASTCVTRFILALIALMEHGAKVHLRNLSEYFGLLLEFSRMGDEETIFLLRVGLIKTVADFYLGNKSQDCIDVGSDNDDNSSDEALSIDKTRPASLDKMICLVANLVDRSRGPDLRLRLAPRDFNAIAGGKGFPFLYQQIKDNINPHQTKHLIHALCRFDDRLASQIISMLFASVTKHTELCGPFFKLLTLLTESQVGPSGLPCFSQLVLQRVWEAAEYCPQSALDWLSFQAPKNKIAHTWILQSADEWLEPYLLSHNNVRVRNAAAYLLVSLVPSQPFRTNYRNYSLHKHSTLATLSYRELSPDAQVVLHSIIGLLLRLLRSARLYTDITVHGTSKLTAYFGLLSYCMVSKTEKLLIGPAMRALWDLFHPRLSEPSVPAHHNKHALLSFWHQSLVDCPENALTVANSPEITRNIAFNYILADHDDSEIVSFNRSMLPAYYGLLRLCCEQSRSLTRQLAAHQNLQWGFKNITPHPTQYSAAVDELFKLMTMFATRHPDASDQEKLEVTTFRRTTLSMYLTSLEARVSWSTLITALKILVDNDDDRLLVIYNGGIEMCFEALHTLHSMHHEATACHVAGDIQELLQELSLLLTTLRVCTRGDGSPPNMPSPAALCSIVSATNKNMFSTPSQQQLEAHAQQLQHHQQLLQKQQEQFKAQMTQTQHKDQKQLQQQMQEQLQLHQMQQLQQQHQQQQHYLRQRQLQSIMVKGLPDAVKRLATLLNTFNPPETSRLALEVLKELVRNPNFDIIGLIVPMMLNCHLSVASTPTAIGPLGMYFPRRGAKPQQWAAHSKNAPRPPRPMVQMCVPHSEVIQKGNDPEYDAALDTFYRPYHDFIDVVMRMAVNTNQLNDTLVKLSCLVAIEGARLQFTFFAKFWVGIYNNSATNKYAELLIKNHYLLEYIHIILRDERGSLNDQYMRNFIEIYYPKISGSLPIARLLYTITYSMHSKEDPDELCGDLFAIRVIAQYTGIPASVRKQLRASLKAKIFKASSSRELTDGEGGEIFPYKKIRLDGEQQQQTPKAAGNEAAPQEPAKESKKDNENGEVEEAAKRDELNARQNAATTAAERQADNERTPEKQMTGQGETTASTPHKEGDDSARSSGDVISPRPAEKVTDSLEDTAKMPRTPTQKVGGGDGEGNGAMDTTSAGEVEAKPVYSRTVIGDTIITTSPVKSVTGGQAVDAPCNSSRSMEEEEKRYKTMLIVESTVRTILALMQKDENAAAATAVQGGDDMESAVAAAAAELSSSEEADEDEAGEVDVEVDCDVDVEDDDDEEDDDEEDDDDDDGILEMMEPMSVSASDNDIDAIGIVMRDEAVGLAHKVVAMPCSPGRVSYLTTLHDGMTINHTMQDRNGNGGVATTVAAAAAATNANTLSETKVSTVSSNCPSPPPPPIIGATAAPATATATAAATTSQTAEPLASESSTLPGSVATSSPI